MSTTTDAPPATRITLLDSADDFCNRVMAACRDSTGRAALRSALGRTPMQSNRAHMTMARLVPQGANDERESVYYAVAAMIATLDRAQSWAPSGRRPDLGSTLGELVYRNMLAANSATVRLEIMPRSTLQSMLAETTRTVTLARNQRVYVDWGILLRDALLWRTHQPEVVKRWAYSYARYTPPAAARKTAGEDPAGTDKAIA